MAASPGASPGQPLPFCLPVRFLSASQPACLPACPAAGMKKPQDLWVDFVSGNSTQPKLPTMIVIKGEVQREKWFYLPVKYTLVSGRCTARQ